MMKNKKGFTLLELLIVVAIIGVLIAIAVPTLSSSIRASKEAVCNANRRSLQALLCTTYITDHTEEGIKQTYDDNISKYTCPFGGRITYELNDGVISMFCSHCKIKDPLSDVDQMSKLLTGFPGLAKGGFYNNASSAANKKIISDGLKNSGVELDSLTNWALRYDNGGYPKLYWSYDDISEITKGTTYVMAFTLTTHNYTVWKVNVSNGVITGEVSVGGLMTPKVEDQTYEKSLAKYNELTGR